MEAYENNFPQGVYDNIRSPVDIMDTSMEGINMGTVTHVDTEVIFNKTLCIIGSGEFDLHGLFYYDLEESPTSLLLYDRSMRPACESCNNYLQVEESSRTGETPDLIGLQMFVQYCG